MFQDPVDYECLNIPAVNFTIMGFSVRTADTRYTEWRHWKRTGRCVGDWSDEGLVAQELYDHVSCFSFFLMYVTLCMLLYTDGRPWRWTAHVR